MVAMVYSGKSIYEWMVYSGQSIYEWMVYSGKSIYGSQKKGRAKLPETIYDISQQPRHVVRWHLTPVCLSQETPPVGRLIPNRPMGIWMGSATPLKNISQLGWLFPIYGKIKRVPNHQPVYQTKNGWCPKCFLYIAMFDYRRGHDQKWGGSKSDSSHPIMWMFNGLVSSQPPKNGVFQWMNHDILWGEASRNGRAQVYQVLTYGAFRKSGCTPSHPLMDFPWNKPSSVFGVPPMARGNRHGFQRPPSGSLADAEKGNPQGIPQAAWMVENHVNNPLILWILTLMLK